MFSYFYRKKKKKKKQKTKLIIYAVGYTDRERDFPDFIFTKNVHRAQEIWIFQKSAEEKEKDNLEYCRKNNIPIRYKDGENIRGLERELERERERKPSMSNSDKELGFERERSL